MPHCQVPILRVLVIIVGFFRQTSKVERVGWTLDLDKAGTTVHTVTDGMFGEPCKLCTA